MLDNFHIRRIQRAVGDSNRSTIRILVDIESDDDLLLRWDRKQIFMCVFFNTTRRTERPCRLPRFGWDLHISAFHRMTLVDAEPFPSKLVRDRPEQI